MLSGKHLALAVALLLLGACTALMFQRPREAAPVSVVAQSDLVAPQETSRLPLRVQPESEPREKQTSRAKPSSQPPPPPLSQPGAVGSAQAAQPPLAHSYLPQQQAPQIPIAPRHVAPPAGQMVALPEQTQLAQRPTSVAAGVSAAGTVREHVIKDGDTLEDLAARYLGAPERAAEIFHLNHQTLTHPEILPIGKTLSIPPANSPPARQSAGGQTSSPDQMVPVPWPH